MRPRVYVQEGGRVTDICTMNASTGPKRILVTGGAGFIGSHTAVALVDAGYEPVIVDDLRNSRSEVLDGLERILGRRVAYHCVDCGDEQGMAAIF